MKNIKVKKLWISWKDAGKVSFRKLFYVWNDKVGEKIVFNPKNGTASQFIKQYLRYCMYDNNLQCPVCFDQIKLDVPNRKIQIHLHKTRL